MHYEAITPQQACKLLLQYVTRSEWESAIKMMTELYGPSAHQLQVWREVGDCHENHLFQVNWKWECRDRTGKILPIRQKKALSCLNRGKEKAEQSSFSLPEGAWFTEKWRVTDVYAGLLEEVLFEVLGVLPQREAIYLVNQPPDSLPHLAIRKDESNRAA